MTHKHSISVLLAEVSPRVQRISSSHTVSELIRLLNMSMMSGLLYEIHTHIGGVWLSCMELVHH